MKFEGSGSEQTGWRPGLVFQNNKGNKHSPNIIALPITSAIKRTDMPTHVFLPASETGLLKDSIVLCENPERMSKDKVGKRITTLPDLYMAKIAEASMLAFGVISFVDPKRLMSVWEKSKQLQEVNHVQHRTQGKIY